MNLFKKIFGKKEETVSLEAQFWAGVFKPAEYQRFIKLVSDYFDQHREPYKIENGMVYVQEPGGSQSLGLQNIAQQCRQEEPGLWPEMIQRHFNLLLNPPSNSDTGPEFDTVASSLSVRLWPNGTLDAVGKDALVYREDLPGTISTLVIDYPEMVESVTPAVTMGWGKTMEELFEIGMVNLRRLCQPEIQVQELNQGVKMHVLSSDSIFTASYALLLEEFPKLLGTYGTLFGVPHRHTIICYPIESVEVMDAMQQLFFIVQGMFQEGPGSISPYLYWYHQGRYVAIMIDHQKKQVYIPPEFTEMLNMLAEQQKG